MGADSFKVYYQKYNRMDKELEGANDGYSPATAYLSKIKSLKLLPSPLGLIHHTNNHITVRAPNKQLGKHYALALSSSMKYLSNTQVVQLPGNRLGDSGSAAIISSLVERVRQINLDNNKIGEEGMRKLSKWIESMGARCQLEELSLEKN